MDERDIQHSLKEAIEMGFEAKDVCWFLSLITYTSRLGSP